MHKDLRKIEKELHRQDFDTIITRRGHMAVYKGGDFVTVFAGSPSDYRSWANSLAHCRRWGFQWPPPRR